MECGFCRRQGENQPVMTRIHRLEPQKVAEKDAIRLSVFSVDNYVSIGNHLRLLRNGQNPQQSACSVETSKTQSQTLEMVLRLSTNPCPGLNTALQFRERATA